MRIDIEEKQLSLSVREFVYSVNNTGNMNFLSSRLRTKIGQLVHKEYQRNQVGENAKTEYYIKFEFKVDDWTIQVKGFIDVIYFKENSIHIEEIKSISIPVHIYRDNVDIHHETQLQLYAHYFTKYEKTSNVFAYLIVVDNTKKMEKIPIHILPQDEFLEKQVRKIITFFEKDQEQKQVQKNRVNSLKFPFPNYRKNQKEIIETIYEKLKDMPRIMLSAPPGIGKTLSTFYPALKYTLENSLRLFIVTSKTTQQEMYKKTVKALVDAGGDFKSIILTSKRKICRGDEQNCEANICEYLDHYEKIDPKIIISDLMDLKLIDKNDVTQIAEIHGICPFELSLDISLECDVIIGDYNYVFDPRVQLQRYFRKNYDDIIIIVDEAHGLPTRANDYYSLAISLKEVRKVITYVDHAPIDISLRLNGRTVLQKLYSYIQSLRDQIQNFDFIEHTEIELDIPNLESIHDKYDFFVIEYVYKLMQTLPEYELRERIVNDPIIGFAEKLKFFYSLAIESREDEYSQLYDVEDSTMRILCKSSHKNLKKQFRGFHSVIVQSATLLPGEYYQNILGLPENTIQLKYPSPFPPQNHLYLSYPKISTRYANRERFIPIIAELIKSVIKLKVGNYIIFSPSFSYQEKLLSNFKNDNIYTIVKQETSMSDYERRQLLEKMKRARGNLLFAVMGGIFSEGVDFIGDMAIGVFICGPALPQFTFDRELMKQYFDKEFKFGFDYAYRNPGITKVIQSVGRIFRKETDQGFAVLLGRRFSDEYYSQVLPLYWDLTLTDDIVGNVHTFWNKLLDKPVQNDN